MRKTAVLLLIHFTCHLFAQPAGRFDLLSVNEGLSQGMVFDILQSKDDYP